MLALAERGRSSPASFRSLPNSADGVKQSGEPSSKDLQRGIAWVSRALRVRRLKTGHGPTPNVASLSAASGSRTGLPF